MKIITTITEMQTLSDSLRMQGRKLGFVPTMGSLHEGHLSLMRRARKENDIVAASIFVNPTQFGPQEDLERYPRDAEGDRAKCDSVGVDYLFMPATAEMYPDKQAVFVTIGGVSEMLEGASRPGHFTGVATVVAKLFNIVQPHKAYFGQKDYQQCVVIKRMASGLNLPVEIVMMPTVREPDGLAMSSRNSYLSEEERLAAASIWRALGAVEHLFRFGMRDSEALKKAVRDVLLQVTGLAIDYLEVVDAVSLVPLASAGQAAVMLVAVRLGQARLIDNIILGG